MRFSTSKEASYGFQFFLEISSMILVVEETCSLLCPFFHFCLEHYFLSFNGSKSKSEKEKPQSTLAECIPAYIFNDYCY